MAEKSNGKLNAYTIPLDPNIDLRRFSKEFLAQIADYWNEYFEAYHNTIIRIGAETEGVGVQNIYDIQKAVVAELAPAMFPDVAKYLEMEPKVVDAWIRRGSYLPFIDFHGLSKEALLRVMKYFAEYFEAYQATYVKIATPVEGVGPLLMTEMQIALYHEVIGPVFRKVAKLCKVDINTMEGLFKANRFIPDNMSDHYIGGEIDIISDNEATLTYDKCTLVESGLWGDDIAVYNYICETVEPAISEAYMGYGSRKVKVKMLWYPKTLPPPTDKPICRWHFQFID